MPITCAQGEQTMVKALMLHLSMSLSSFGLYNVLNSNPIPVNDGFLWDEAALNTLQASGPLYYNDNAWCLCALSPTFICWAMANQWKVTSV